MAPSPRLIRQSSQWAQSYTIASLDWLARNEFRALTAWAAPWLEISYPPRPAPVEAEQSVSFDLRGRCYTHKKPPVQGEKHQQVQQQHHQPPSAHHRGLCSPMTGRSWIAAAVAAVAPTAKPASPLHAATAIIAAADLAGCAIIVRKSTTATATATAAAGSTAAAAVGRDKSCAFHALTDGVSRRGISLQSGGGRWCYGSGAGGDNSSWSCSSSSSSGSGASVHAHGTVTAVGYSTSAAAAGGHGGGVGGGDGDGAERKAASNGGSGSNGSLGSGEQGGDGGDGNDGSLGRIQPRLVMVFTCAKCETRSTKSFSKHSYTRGVVLVRCPGCQKLHLIADHLGWFGEEPFMLHEFMGGQGQNVIHVADQSTSEAGTNAHVMSGNGSVWASPGRAPAKSHITTNTTDTSTTTTSTTPAVAAATAGAAAEARPSVPGLGARTTAAAAALQASEGGVFELGSERQVRDALAAALEIQESQR